MMDDMNALHPGCMVATVTYQERMFDAEVRQMNVDYLLRMRERFVRWLDEIVAKYPPRIPVEVGRARGHFECRRRGRDHPVEGASATQA